MTPDSDKLADAIAGLHQALSQLTVADDRSQQALKALLPEIGRLLGQSDPGTASAAAVAATDSPHHLLEDLAVGFEAEHPALAANLRQIVDALGKGGL